MKALPVGTDALLVEVASGEEAQALLADLLRRRAEGSLTVREIVPAARTVLLDGLSDPARLAAELTSRPVPPVPPRTAGTVEIPVRYDGPDLADVAAHWGVPEAEVARIHADAEFRVAFCGFAPGFGYLTGLPARYEAPRRSTPRTSVPAGSVALAGPYTGVYPRPSPAAGSSSAPRTSCCGTPPGSPRRCSPRHARAVRPGGPDGTGDMTDRALSVVRAGALTTVQDRGRPGHAHLGVPAPAHWTARPPRSPTGWWATARTPPSWRPPSTAAPCDPVRPSRSRSPGRPAG